MAKSHNNGGVKIPELPSQSVVERSVELPPHVRAMLIDEVAPEPTLSLLAEIQLVEDANTIPVFTVVLLNRHRSRFARIRESLRLAGKTYHSDAFGGMAHVTMNSAVIHWMLDQFEIDDDAVASLMFDVPLAPIQADVEAVTVTVMSRHRRFLSRLRASLHANHSSFLDDHGRTLHVDTTPSVFHWLLDQFTGWEE